MRMKGGDRTALTWIEDLTIGDRASTEPANAGPYGRCAIAGRLKPAPTYEAGLTWGRLYPALVPVLPRGAGRWPLPWNVQLLHAPIGRFRGVDVGLGRTRQLVHA